ncbi:MAG: ABC transporter substrate-binding protein [Ardenticatenaceae bacterium]|nr:ABC transporter substrate-binding protein [Ardenticatenaceae bacterium]
MSKISQWVSLLILGMLFAVGLSGCQPQDDAWQTIQRRGVLRVGLDPTYPPFENADTGELEGIDVDLARALGETLEVEVTFVYFGFDGLYDALATDQVDVLISALVEDISKTRDFAFSDPYFNAGQFLFIHQDAPEKSLTMADMENHLLAVELGSEGHVQSIEWSRKINGLEIKALPTADDALWLVTQGEAHAAMVDQISGRLYRQNFPELAMVAEPVTVEPFAIVTRIDDQSLLEAVNDGLAQLTEDGTIETILHRWLD